MTLEEMEASLQERLDYVSKSERASAEDWLRCMEVLAQVKQAQHLESLDSRLDAIARTLNDMYMDG